MSDFLTLMGRGSERRLQEARGRVSERQLLAQIAALPAAPALVFNAAGFDVIAELKLVSPAAGRLTDQADNVTARVSAYARGGAVAVSVLTEPSRFGGSLDHLQEAAAALLESGVPVMRKDFLVSPYQVLEARAVGAGGVLVILAMLDDASCRAIIDTALEHGMFVLLEAFDQGELERAGKLLAALPQTDQLLLGLNCRDLRSLRVDPERFVSAVASFPGGCRRVAESGIESPAKARWARELGYDMALVGTALMRSGDPEQALAELLAAGRVVPGAGG
ncbi:MAG: indole-3-glycerol-phosphate synthase [Gammaproteobacteria bacterium]|nr:indole-3-glycerol-phosphate synthase [Gammaproteobacteria bacterium]